MSWRSHSAKIIAEVIRETFPNRRKPFSEEEQKALRRTLRDSYPFGERAMHPYKIWCSEVNRQIGRGMKTFQFGDNGLGLAERKDE